MSANETTQVTAVPTFDCRQTFVETLIELATADKRIVAVCNDSVGSSNLGAFAKQFPDRLVNVGIAEQNMVGVAAGLANGGFLPFVCAAGPFLSGRATEQVKADIAYSSFFGGKKVSGTDPVANTAGQPQTYASHTNPLYDRDFLSVSVSYSF